ncbi:MAG: hypothetical protein RSD96_00650 [Bacilli bacterium]
MSSELKELSFEKIIWVVFIIISLLNIYGTSLLEEYAKTKDSTDKLTAKKIFIFTVIVSFLIYAYFVYRNYKQLKENERNNKDTKLYYIRFIGSLLIIAGVLFILYFQIFEPDLTGSPAI